MAAAAAVDQIVVTIDRLHIARGDGFQCKFGERVRREVVAGTDPEQKIAFLGGVFGSDRVGFSGSARDCERHRDS